MRVRSIVPYLMLAACGGGEGMPPGADAPSNVDIGFNRPTASLKANMEVSEDMWQEIGPADLTCLNTPSADQATTVAVALSTVVRDFQSDNLVPNAAVTAFANQDIDAPFFTGAADGNAAITVDIPVGTTRFGYKMVDDSSLDTLLLNQRVDPDNPVQTESSINSVSKSTAQTLPALIGISRTQGTGVLAGAIRDCQDREISNFIATVALNSTTDVDAIQFAPGTDTYYFSSSVGLPVRHTQKPMGSEDGLFMVVELAPTPTAFVTMWGYLTDADLASDTLTKIAELQTSVIPDTVITGSYEPLRTE
jgi:hypothetical protein